MNITSTIRGKGNKIKRAHPIESFPYHRTRVTRFKFQTRQTPMAANSAPLSAFQSPSKSSRFSLDSSNHSNGKLSIKRRLCRDYSSTNRPSRIINGIFDDLGGAWLESTSSDRDIIAQAYDLMVHSTLGPCINRLDFSCLDKNHPPPSSIPSPTIVESEDLYAASISAKKLLGKDWFGLKIVGFVRGWILHFYFYNTGGNCLLYDRFLRTISKRWRMIGKLNWYWKISLVFGIMRIDFNKSLSIP